MDFLVDTGAEFSVLQHPLGKLTDKTSLVVGATGMKIHKWTTAHRVNLGAGRVSHSFLVVPECPTPLLGRDLLTKMNAEIQFSPEGPRIKWHPPRPVWTLTFNLADEYRIHEKGKKMDNPQWWLSRFPEAWAETGGVGMASQVPPIVIAVKSGATPISVRQYPMGKEAKEGIRPHINKFLQLGILTPCRSSWNTPLLPVKKPGTRDYRPVQDLREVNKRVEDVHPIVPNPYTLLSTLPPERIWYTVLDLKDAFFSLRLHPTSQHLFAFEWKDPETGHSGQLT